MGERKRAWSPVSNGRCHPLLNGLPAKRWPGLCPRQKVEHAGIQPRCGHWFVFLSICCILFPQIVGAQALFTEYFESLDNWNLEGSGTGKIVEVSDEKQFADSVNDQALHVFFPQSAWSNTSAGKRVEIARQDTRLTQYGEERWYSLSIFVPQGYGVMNGETVDVHAAFQFHAMPDNVTGCVCPGNCDQWRSPPLALLIRPGDVTTWYFNVRYSEAQYNCDGNGSVTTVDLDSYQTFEPVVQEGGWTTWIFHVVWDPFVSGDGLFEAWIRDSAYPAGVQVIDYTGPVGFNDVDPPYLKMGIYHWSSDWSDEVSALELFFDRILVGTSREDVALQSGTFFVIPRAGVIYLDGD